MTSVAGSDISVTDFPGELQSGEELTGLDGQRRVLPREPEGVSDLLVGRVEPSEEGEYHVIILVDPCQLVSLASHNAIARHGTYDATASWKLANSEDEAIADESNTVSASEPDPLRANASIALDTPA